MLLPLLQYYSRNQGMSLGSIILLLAFLVIVYTFIKAMQSARTVKSNWYHMFDSVPFTSQELYEKVAELIQKREIPHLTMSITTHSQGSLFAPKREYLQLRYGNCAFDICAAPFGTGYFVSWWMFVIETGEPLRDFFVNLPLIGKIFSKREKTFFELDTESMFKETVKDCVKESIETLTTLKGVRRLSDAEWQTRQMAPTEFSVQV